MSVVDIFMCSLPAKPSVNKFMLNSIFHFEVGSFPDPFRIYNNHRFAFNIRGKESSHGLPLEPFVFTNHESNTRHYQTGREGCRPFPVNSFDDKEDRLDHIQLLAE